MNINNSINEEFENNNRYNNNDNNYLTTNNELLQSLKNKNNKDINSNCIVNSVNNKLKGLYLKLKTINEKQKSKHFKCRLCYGEGDFEGDNPLISPCKCTGSVTYIHLICLRKWLTSKITTKASSTNNIYCYTFKSLECEICKSIIPEIVEYRGKYISLIEMKDVEPPYIILQTMYQYNSQNRNISDFNAIFVMSFKLKDYLMIGRANNSDIRLSDVSVSRNHSIISYYDGNFYIDDIGSKFGTLLLIQNNILFLPYKEISLQTGKCHLIFRLKRTCLGFFKCYNNKMYEKMSYEDYFKTKDKKVYFQILKSFNKNIIDPLEKFSTINGSFSSNDNDNDKDNDNNNTANINSDEDKKIEIESEIKEEKDEDDEKTEKLDTINHNYIDENLNLRYMFENSIISNDIKKNNELNNNIENNNENNLINRNSDKRPTINLNIKENETRLKMTGSFFTKKINNSFTNEKNKRQNESNDILFHNDMKSTYNNKIHGKKTKNINFSILNIINILKKSNINKEPNSVLNLKNNGKVFNTCMNKNNKSISALNISQKEKIKINKSFD